MITYTTISVLSIRGAYERPDYLLICVEGIAEKATREPR